jgi:F-type H+-transporting ATPase subunit delta
MSVSRSYASALLEAATELGLKAEQLDSIEQELAAFSGAVVASRDLAEALRSPVVASADKAEVVSAIATKMGFSDLSSKFLVMIARKERASLLASIVEAFTAVRLESEGATFGHVVSADALKKEDLEELAMAFSRKLGKKVVFKSEVDEDLLAGLKVTVGGVTYDGSLRSQLKQLRERLVYGKPALSH